MLNVAIIFRDDSGLTQRLEEPEQRPTAGANIVGERLSTRCFIFPILLHVQGVRGGNPARRSCGASGSNRELIFPGRFRGTQFGVPGPAPALHAARREHVVHRREQRRIWTDQGKFSATADRGSKSECCDPPALEHVT